MLNVMNEVMICVLLTFASLGSVGLLLMLTSNNNQSHIDLVALNGRVKSMLCHFSSNYL